jgi:hypothetical protein
LICFDSKTHFHTGAFFMAANQNQHQPVKVPQKPAQQQPANKPAQQQQPAKSQPQAPARS